MIHEQSKHLLNRLTCHWSWGILNEQMYDKELRVVSYWRNRYQLQGVTKASPARWRIWSQFLVDDPASDVQQRWSRSVYKTMFVFSWLFLSLVITVGSRRDNAELRGRTYLSIDGSSKGGNCSSNYQDPFREIFHAEAVCECPNTKCSWPRHICCRQESTLLGCFIRSQSDWQWRMTET